MASFKAFKGKKFNFGNKTGQLARKVEEGTKLEMTVYDLLEVIPPARNGQEYEGDPYLYMLCEHEDKKGYRIRCNDEDALKEIVESGKPEYPITVMSSKFVDAVTKRETFYFTLESWG